MSSAEREETVAAPPGVVDALEVAMAKLVKEVVSRPKMSLWEGEVRGVSDDSFVSASRVDPAPQPRCGLVESSP